MPAWGAHVRGVSVVNASQLSAVELYSSTDLVKMMGRFNNFYYVTCPIDFLHLPVESFIDFSAFV